MKTCGVTNVLSCHIVSKSKKKKKCRKVVKKLSKCCQNVAKKLSKSCQKVVPRPSATIFEKLILNIYGFLTKIVLEMDANWMRNGGH
jgi:hypothetical protein